MTMLVMASGRNNRMYLIFINFCFCYVNTDI